MKKSNEFSRRLRDVSSLFNRRQRTLPSSINILRDCKVIEVSDASKSLYQNDKILDSWNNAESRVSFYNYVERERRKNDISLNRNIVKNGYIDMASDSSTTSCKVSHIRSVGSTPQRLQKIILSGYAPHRFPVTSTSAPHSCWPKSCYGNSTYFFISGTINLPSTIPDSSSVEQPVLSISDFRALSANEEQTDYPNMLVSGRNPGNRSQSFMVRLLRRFGNGTYIILEVDSK